MTTVADTVAVKSIGFRLSPKLAGAVILHSANITSTAPFADMFIWSINGMVNGPSPVAKAPPR
jgi:hypothetical protein